MSVLGPGNVIVMELVSQATPLVNGVACETRLLLAKGSFVEGVVGLG